LQDAVSKLPEGAPLPTVLGKDVEASHHDLSTLVLSLLHDRRLGSCHGHPNSKLQNPNDSGFWSLDFLASFGFHIYKIFSSNADSQIYRASFFAHASTSIYLSV